MNLLTAHALTLTIGTKNICRDLNLPIKPGEVWGILGANGSGKTTLLHTLAGLHPVTHGNILLESKSLKKLSSKEIARSLGILFQDFNAHFPQTVWDYCLAARYPHQTYFQPARTHDKQIVHDALQQMELHTYANKKITALSGGEKRRLAIAALLAQTPQIYLLDEPSNHLDVRHQFQTLNYFRQLADTQSAAVVMTLHDINHAQQFCDHILLLYPHGEIVQGEINLLTEQHLSRLYQHPISSFTHNNVLYWHYSNS